MDPARSPTVIPSDATDATTEVSELVDAGRSPETPAADGLPGDPLHRTPPTSGPRPEQDNGGAVKSAKKSDDPLLVFDPTIWAPHGPEFFHPPALGGIPVVKHHAHVTGLWAGKAQLVGLGVFSWWWWWWARWGSSDVDGLLFHGVVSGRPSPLEAEEEEAGEWFGSTEMMGGEDPGKPSGNAAKTLVPGRAWGEYLLATMGGLQGGFFYVHPEDPEWPLS
ncbi:hypothetical protein F4779DRAFT_608689 [Xylariaceae sp. FL0662B]|nr:hypothetical protein F4779DRAFT_608689 [Xylariaceae sp. FL0662B]